MFFHAWGGIEKWNHLLTFPRQFHQLSLDLRFSMGLPRQCKVCKVNSGDWVRLIPQVHTSSCALQFIQSLMLIHAMFINYNGYVLYNLMNSNVFLFNICVSTSYFYKQSFGKLSHTYLVKNMSKIFLCSISIEAEMLGCRMCASSSFLGCGSACTILYSHQQHMCFSFPLVFSTTRYQILQSRV